MCVQTCIWERFLILVFNHIQLKLIAIQNQHTGRVVFPCITLSTYISFESTKISLSSKVAPGITLFTERA